MRTFAERRRVAILLTVLAALVVLAFYWARAHSLNRTAFFTGWLLLSVMMVLTAYNLRKKLSFLPILRSATWLQIHLYLGLLTIPMFLAHTGFRVPNGGLETLLTVLFILVVGSGLVGIFITRSFPRRLAVCDEELMFERMPIYRRNLHEAAQKLVLESVAETGTTTIADYYRNRLNQYFAGFRNYWFHLVESKRPRHNYETEFGDLDRYLNDREKELAGQLAQLVYVKDELDYQRALQGTLKGWLFVHIAVTYSLLTCVVAHVIIVHAFMGRMP